MPWPGGGWLELVWARGPGLTEAAGHLGPLDPVLVCAIKVEGECKQWHLSASPAVERVLAVSPPFSPCYRVSKWVFFTYIVFWFFKGLCFFCCTPGWANLHVAPQSCPSLLQLVMLGVGFPSLPCLRLSSCSLHGPSVVWHTEAVQPLVGPSGGAAALWSADPGWPWEGDSRSSCADLLDTSGLLYLSAFQHLYLEISQTLYSVHLWRKLSLSLLPLSPPNKQNQTRFFLNISHLSESYHLISRSWSGSMGIIRDFCHALVPPAESVSGSYRHTPHE